MVSFFSDALIEKIKLKKSLIVWQTISVSMILILLFLIKFVDFKKIFFYGEPYIARIAISGFIDKDYERDRVIRSISNDKLAQGLLIHLDSPGGTLIGGETLYTAIKEVAAKKKVAVVMGSIATSGAYMTAIAADHIIAHHGTITGSVGVIMHSPDISSLMNFFGVNLNIIRSGKMKGVPSLFESLSEEGKQSLDASLNDAYQYFINLVVLERNIQDIEVINDIATGKIYTANQALKISLIDKIGNEDDALHWFDSNDIKVKIKDVSLTGSKGMRRLPKISAFLFGQSPAAEVINSAVDKFSFRGILALFG